MNEKPILFQGDMVIAVLTCAKCGSTEFVKSQTRRVVKPQPKLVHAYYPIDGTIETERLGKRPRCPYGVPGTKLWVRETWGINNCFGFPRKNKLPVFEYTKYDGTGIPVGLQDAYELFFPATQGIGPDYPMYLRPSIFMPRWASRITLEVTGVRVERVQEITEDGAKAEGCEKAPVPHYAASYATAFRMLWDSINAKRGFPWLSNPFVWVVEFRRITQTGGER